MLCIAATHPIQYQAPLFRLLAQEFRLPIHVIYGSDFSVQGYFDKEFRTQFAWDVDLTAGYSHEFLSHCQTGGADNYDAVKADGLHAAIAARKPKVVMALGYAHPFDRATLAAARALKIPALLRGETNDLARARSWLKATARDLWLRRLYRSIDGFLYIGTNSKSHYQRLGVPAAKLWFSPYGVDPSPFELSPEALSRHRQAQRAAHGWAEQDVVLICSGKLFAKKGQDLLLHAAARLPRPMQERVVIALLGEGEAREELTALAEQIQPVRVHFYGFKNQRELTQAFAAADIAVQPSRAGETWGLVLNEALLHGLPVIASALVGSATDLVVPGQTGLVVPPEDAPALAHAIEREIERLPQHRAEISRQLAEQFSLKNAAIGIVAAYKQLTGSTRAA